MKPRVLIGALALVLVIAIAGGLSIFWSVPQSVPVPQPPSEPVPSPVPEPVPVLPRPVEPKPEQPQPGIPVQPPAGGSPEVEKAVQTAMDFIVKAPTFKFDGIADTLNFVDAKVLESYPPQYVITLTFQSKSAGYGDRTGKVLAAVITKHIAVIKVIESRVTSAILDEKWDELNQQMLQGTVILTEGQREGPLLVEKIYSDYITGQRFIEYPVARLEGTLITLRIGDSVSNGCTITLTLLKIQDKTAIFAKTENKNRPCPICLSENTIIDTPNGPVKITELKMGMLVWTSDLLGHRQIGTILKTSKTAVSAHYMVHQVLDDGRELFVSQGHPTADSRILGDLKPGDSIDNARIIISELVPYEGDATYDILPSGETGFYWANGILIGSTLK